jgi:hypothetical protein
MIPRTVQIAKEVAATLTAPQLKALGNVIYNGYATTGANTTNKKAWQYKETVGAPVNLPSVTSYTPAMLGWTTNYMQYYTQLGPVPGYDTTSGDPTMFDYVVHSFTAQQGVVTGLGKLQAGQGYTPGSYTNVATIGGSGVGATLNLTVDVNGVVTVAALNAAGSGYAAGDGLGVASPGALGSGYGFAVAVATVSNVSPAGQPKWNQVPHRYFQNQVGTTGPSPSINYPDAIQYSFIYPIADSIVPPPVDAL